MNNASHIFDLIRSSVESTDFGKTGHTITTVPDEVHEQVTELVRKKWLTSFIYLIDRDISSFVLDFLPLLFIGIAALGFASGTVRSGHPIGHWSNIVFVSAAVIALLIIFFRWLAPRIGFRKAVTSRSYWLKIYANPVENYTDTQESTEDIRKDFVCTRLEIHWVFNWREHMVVFVNEER